MKPDFLIIGASRSGTTTLHSCLKNVPGIYMPDKKEVHFFDMDSEYHKGIDYYFENFKASMINEIKGEATPAYLHKGIIRLSDGSHGFSEFDSAARIKKDLSEVKIIITLRNPIDRLYSQYFRNFFLGREKKDLSVALKEELAGKRDPEVTPLCWIYKNMYSVHLSYWISMFGSDNIHVMIFENWIKDTEILKDVVEFLGIPRGEYNIKQVPKVNAGRTTSNKAKLSSWWLDFFGKRKEYGRMPADVRQELKEVLAHDMQKTEALLDMDLSIWKK